MIDPLLLIWIFAQAAQSVPPIVASNIVTAILSPAVTLGLVRYFDNRAKQKAVNERATIDADKALKLAEIEARRAHEEEVTGQHELARPFAEQTATAERAERRHYQKLVRELDTKLAASNERVAVLGAEVERLASKCEALMAQVGELLGTCRAQGEAIIREHAAHEKTLDWIDEHLPGKAPRPEALPDGIEVVRAVRVDPRREP